MTAHVFNIAIEQGATFKGISFVFNQGKVVDGVVEVGEPHDLTDWVGRMQIRETVTSPAVLAEATTENGSIVLGGPTGRVDVIISDEVTDTLRVKKGVYDLELESPAGEVFRILQGAVTISPNVTRAG